MEQEWEMLRLRREKEAEENMKELILQKEDDLLKELKRLGDEKEIKDAENERDSRVNGRGIVKKRVPVKRAKVLRNHIIEK